MTDPDPAAAEAAAVEARRVALGPLGDPDSVVYEIGALSTAPAWLCRAVDEHNRLASTGHGYGCEHVADAPRLGVETVVHLAVWMPGYVACTDCTAAGIWAVDGVEDQTCDVCRQPSPTGLVRGTFQRDAVIVHYGLCWPCQLSKADM